MNNHYRLLLTALAASGLYAAGCASGETVPNSGGSGGFMNVGTGGSNVTGAGGFIASGSGGRGVGGTIVTGSGGNVATGSGGMVVVGGSGGMVVVGGTGGGATAFMMNCTPAAPQISNLEDGVFYFGTGCPKGSWYLSVGGGGTPTAGGDAIPVAVTDRAGSTKAIHVMGMGQKNTTATSFDAHVSLSASLNSPSATQTGSLNATAYTGIKFWGKIQGSIAVAVSNKNTHPAGAVCSGSATMQCYDHAQKILTPSTTWTEYTVSFAELMQRGFGNPAGTPFPHDTIYTIELQAQVDPVAGTIAPWNIWVDDLTFY